MQPGARRLTSRQLLLDERSRSVLDLLKCTAMLQRISVSRLPPVTSIDQR